jgi:uncharacterized membrane protein
MNTTDATAYKFWRFILVPFSNWIKGSPEFVCFALQLIDSNGVVMVSFCILGLGFVIGFDTKPL